MAKLVLKYFCGFTDGKEYSKHECNTYCDGSIHSFVSYFNMKAVATSLEQKIEEYVTSHERRNNCGCVLVRWKVAYEAEVTKECIDYFPIDAEIVPVMITVCTKG